MTSVSSVTLLSGVERDQLTRPVRIDIGKYHTWNPVRECSFVVELDFQRLEALIDTAALGQRVYEFMSIRRPGDVLQYLTIRLVDVGSDVLSIAAARSGREYVEAPPELPFPEFDSEFHWDFDDSPPHVCAWLTHRETAYWPEMMSETLEVVRTAQSRLRQTNDYLTRHELMLIDACRHRRDFWADWREDIHPLPVSAGNVAPSPEAVRMAILELIRREDIRSVSCPFDDFALWRGLVEEQVRRAEVSGLPLQKAFCLCGPDSGLRNLDVEDWGGEVHIPYEGACGSDLFIVPPWHKFYADKVRNGGMLRWAVAKPSNHILVRGDFGELGCATRKAIGEWTLYSSTAPYEDCNPFFGSEVERIKNQVAMAEKPDADIS